ncbi:MAG: DMT family transporter [Thermoleophilaceae bacterium]|nr:DMT family transporter [Thermoleophilaceae bacterium]
MSRRSWLLLGLLSALWGASYLFIKVALEDDMAPTVIVFVRTALAALVLLPLAARAGALGGLRANLVPILVLAVVQMGGPLLLIALGEREITSSLTGILVATAPIFTFLLAFTLDGEERASGLSLAGVVIGIAGVAMLLGVDAGGGAAALAGGLMVVLASFGYGVGAWFVKRRVRDVQPMAMVGATTATVAVLMAPFAALAAPSHAPGLAATGSLAALGVLCTGLAFVIFYSLVSSDGPAKASLVGYIAPGFSIFYGITLLDESFTVATAAGLFLILGGSWLAAEGRPPWVARSAAGGELAAGGVDVAAAGETHRAADAASLENGAKRRDGVAA